MKKYILRCSKVEMPNKERLVSIFLERLLNKKLHVALYPMKHKTLAVSIKYAIELNDNCDEFRDGRNMGARDESSQKSTDSRVIV